MALIWVITILFIEYRERFGGVFIHESIKVATLSTLHAKMINPDKRESRKAQWSWQN